MIPTHVYDLSHSSTRCRTTLIDKSCATDLHGSNFKVYGVLDPVFYTVNVLCLLLGYVLLHMQLLQLARGKCLFNLIILKHKLKILKFTKIDKSDPGGTVNVEKREHVLT